MKQAFKGVGGGEMITLLSLKNNNLQGDLAGKRKVRVALNEIRQEQTRGNNYGTFLSSGQSC